LIFGAERQFAPKSSNNPTLKAKPLVFQYLRRFTGKHVFVENYMPESAGAQKGWQVLPSVCKVSCRLCYPPVECAPTMFHQSRVLTTNAALVALSCENYPNLSSAGISPTQSALLSPFRMGFVLERPSSVSLGTRASFHGSHSSHHSHHSHSSHCSGR